MTESLLILFFLFIFHITHATNLDINIDIDVVLIGFSDASSLSNFAIDNSKLQQLLHRVLPNRIPFNLATKLPFAVQYNFNYNVKQLRVDLAVFEMRLAEHINQNSQSRSPDGTFTISSQILESFIQTQNFDKKRNTIIILNNNRQQIYEMLNQKLKTSTSFSDFSYGYIAGDPKTVNQLASHTWLSPFNWISVDLAAKPLNILTDVVDSFAPPWHNLADSDSPSKVMARIVKLITTGVIAAFAPDASTHVAGDASFRHPITLLVTVLRESNFNASLTSIDMDFVDKRFARMVAPRSVSVAASQHALEQHSHIIAALHRARLDSSKHRRDVSTGKLVAHHSASFDGARLRHSLARVGDLLGAGLLDTHSPVGAAVRRRSLTHDNSQLHSQSAAAGGSSSSSSSSSSWQPTRRIVPVHVFELADLTDGATFFNDNPLAPSFTFDDNVTLVLRTQQSHVLTRLSNGRRGHLLSIDSSDPHRAILAGAIAQLDGIAAPTFYMNRQAQMSAQTEWLCGHQPFDLGIVGGWSERLASLAERNHIVTLVTYAAHQLEQVEQIVHNFDVRFHYDSSAKSLFHRVKSFNQELTLALELVASRQQPMPSTNDARFDVKQIESLIDLVESDRAQLKTAFTLANAQQLAKHSTDLRVQLKQQLDWAQLELQCCQQLWGNVDFV